MTPTNVTSYLTALGDTGVADIPYSTGLGFINLARQEIFDAYPWPFRDTIAANERGVSLSSPWTTPMPSSGGEYPKIKSVLNQYNEELKPISESEMASYGVAFSPSSGTPSSTGTPLYYCVYRVLNSSGGHDTYVVPYPYDTPITVYPLFTPTPLDETTNTVDNFIPPPYMLLVVYRAAVHAYNHVGVPDLAASYQARYTELLDSMIRNQLGATFDVPDIQYEAGA